MSADASAAMAALGNGSAGNGLSAAGSYGGALAGLFGGMAARNMAVADADAARYAGRQAATIARRDTRKAVGTARSATAASGAQLDEFAMPTIADIEFRGAHDAAMADLAGETRALQSLTRGGYEMMSGVQDAAANTLRAASFSGWKGAKSTPKGVFDGGAYYTSQADPVRINRGTADY